MRPEPVHEPGGGSSGPAAGGSTSDSSAGTGDPGSPGGQNRPEYPGWKAVLTPEEIRRALTRVAHEILERTHGGEGVVLLGIPTRGVYLARRLATRIGEFEDVPVPVGSLDVTMHRDDLRLRPARALQRTEVPPDGVDGKTVVLVDDVLFSGRTIRAALDALNDLGRPRAVQLAVLVDRGHRELPIRADYVGKNLPTAHREAVRVLLAEIDGEDSVLLGERAR
jgi:pyrimidine operon attenuation protein/uracil phosphoribosyltransferase